MDLAGQEAILDGLAPRLIGLDRQTDRRSRPGPAPVVQLVGGRLSGKTALLDALHESYTGRVPLAWADLAAPGFGQPGVTDLHGRVEPHASLTTHLLYVLLYRLGGSLRLWRRITFPRLALGLLVVTAWETEHPDGMPPAQLLKAQHALKELLANSDVPRRERRRRLLDWLHALAASLGTALGLPDALVTVVIDTVTPPLLSADPDEATLRWWGGRLRARGLRESDDLRRIFSFWWLFRQQETRALAEEELVAALLADLAAHYGWWRKRNWVPRPVILLDNVHADPGPHLLALLRKAWEWHGTAGEEPIRPVVVTTALDDGREPRPVPYDRVERGAPEAGQLRLALPAMGHSEIGAMLAAARLPARLTRPLARLSGGRAGAARMLVDAAAGDPGLPGFPTAPSGPPGPSGHPAPVFADRLLERLLPQRRVREDLLVAAPALDHEGARRLLAHHTTPESADQRDYGSARRFEAARRELAAGHWRHVPWHWPPGELIDGAVPFVSDRALRALLLHRLTADPEPAAADRWARAHLWLRERYNPHGLPPHDPRHSVPYLHHTLALGRLPAVERCLHHRLTRSPPDDWLTAVNVVCAAPLPPAGLRPPEDTAPCPACATPRDADAHRSLARLVAFVWRCGAPLSPVPDEHDLAPVRAVWPELDHHNPARDVFLSAESAWLTALADGVQPPDLPIPKGSDS